MKGGGKALWKDENIADSITNHAIDFIKKNSNHSFFLYFATNDVHVPRFHTNVSVVKVAWEYVEMLSYSSTGQ